MQVFGVGGNPRKVSNSYTGAHTHVHRLTKHTNLCTIKEKMAFTNWPEMYLKYNTIILSFLFVVTYLCEVNIKY